MKKYHLHHYDNCSISPFWAMNSCLFTEILKKNTLLLVWAYIILFVAMIEFYSPVRLGGALCQKQGLAFIWKSSLTLFDVWLEQARVTCILLWSPIITMFCSRFCCKSIARLRVRSLTRQGHLYSDLFNGGISNTFPNNVVAFPLR